MPSKPYDAVKTMTQSSELCLAVVFTKNKMLFNSINDTRSRIGERESKETCH